MISSSVAYGATFPAVEGLTKASPLFVGGCWLMLFVYGPSRVSPYGFAYTVRSPVTVANRLGDSISALFTVYFGSIWNAPLRHTSSLFSHLRCMTEIILSTCVIRYFIFNYQFSISDLPLECRRFWRALDLSALFPRLAPRARYI